MTKELLDSFHEKILKSNAVDTITQKEMEAFVALKQTYYNNSNHESCQDAISRQAVLEVIEYYPKPLWDYVANELPSVNLVRPRGKWSYAPSVITHVYCSCCNKANKYESNYCPNCGAEMKEE